MTAPWKGRTGNCDSIRAMARRAGSASKPHTPSRPKPWKIAARSTTAETCQSGGRRCWTDFTNRETSPDASGPSSRKTDAERLLQAVGKDRLRSGLPGSLLAVLEGGGRTFDRHSTRGSSHSYVSYVRSQAIPARVDWLGTASALGRLPVRHRLCHLARFLRRMGRATEFTSPTLRRGGRPILASPASRLPKTDRHQSARNAWQRPFPGHSASRDDQSAYRFR